MNLIKYGTKGAREIRNKKVMIKKIGKYFIRIILFLILVGGVFKYFEEIPLSLLDIHLAMPTEVEDFFLLQIGENILIFIAIVFGLFICILSEIITTYFFAKICGLFKELDELKKWQSFLIIIILAIFCFEFSNFLDNYKNIIAFDIRVSYGYAGIFLIPSYLCYLYFKHLTKKHPVPFEKIGYYFSIEFYKNIFNKLMSGIKKKGIK